MTHPMDDLTRPEALRLADDLLAWFENLDLDAQDIADVVAELRRLHAEEERLREREDEMARFIGGAFTAHPNLDLDVEAVRARSQA